MDLSLIFNRYLQYLFVEMYILVNSTDSFTTN